MGSSYEELKLRSKISLECPFTTPAHQHPWIRPCSFKLPHCSAGYPVPGIRQNQCPAHPCEQRYGTGTVLHVYCTGSQSQSHSHQSVRKLETSCCVRAQSVMSGELSPAASVKKAATTSCSSPELTHSPPPRADSRRARLRSSSSSSSSRTPSLHSRSSSPSPQPRSKKVGLVSLCFRQSE